MPHTENMPHLSRKHFFPNIYKFVLPETIGDWQLYSSPPKTFFTLGHGFLEWIYAEYERSDKSSDTLVPFYFYFPGTGWKFKCLKNGIYYFTRKSKRTLT